MTATTTRVHLSRVSDITPGSIVRLGGEGLYKVITPRILECCHTGGWVYDASLYGYDNAEPVRVEFIGNQADPHTRAIIEEEKPCRA